MNFAVPKTQAPAQESRKIMTIESANNASENVPQTQTKSKQVRAHLKEAIENIDSNKFAAAALLCTVRENEYWAGDFESFQDFVESYLGIKLRTAQELIRVHKTCWQVGITAAEVAKAGWSKLAVIAKHLTAENKDDLLNEVASSSYSELQKNYRSTKSKTPETDIPESRTDPDGYTSNLCISHIVATAISHAAIHTRQNDSQTNLEFVASQFIELCPIPSRIPRIDHLN